MFLWIWGMLMTTATADWVTVNDTVMGGVSSSQVRSTEEGFLFSGVVSKENNGGFASVRQNVSRADFLSSDGIRIQGDGDVLAYQVVVWMRGYGPRLYYRHVFYPTGTTQFLSFADFEAVSYGRQVRAPALPQMLDQAYAIGLLLGDGYEGSFQLEVQNIDLASPLAAPPSPDMVTTITQAIEKGVPVFNAGDPAQCADIYENVLRGFLKEDIPEGYDVRVQAILETAQTIEDPISRAWLFRHALDTMLML